MIREFRAGKGCDQTRIERAAVEGAIAGAVTGVVGVEGGVVTGALL